MELGCGAGRVTLHLAEVSGLLVIGLDRDRELVEAIWERGHGTTGDAEQEDVRGFEAMATKFGLVIAPMQLIQLLNDSQERVACLACAVDSLLPGGRAAFAIVEEMPLPPPRHAARRRCPTCARSKAGSTRACRSSRSSDRTRSCCAACARRSTPTAT